MSGNQAPGPAMNEDQSSSSDGGIDSNNVYTSSPNSTPPPPTCDNIDRWRYHIGLEKFGQSLQAAAQAVFPNDRRSRYTDVSVLMLSWADEDPKLPVSEEIDKLQFIFQNIYRFDTEHWKIPAQRSHYMTNQRVMEFVRPRDDSSTHLKIVYYAGHARLMETRALALTSWQNNKKSKAPIVKWSAIQTLLEEDPSDVLILLDCCASGTANACEGAGVNELISACAWNETANGVGSYSFTSALVIELRRLSQKASFTVGELYRNIFWRTQSRMPEDVRQEGRERERHPAPIHLVLTQDAIPRSIQLSVCQERSQIARDGTQIENNGNKQQMDPRAGEIASAPHYNTISPHPTEDDNVANSPIQQSRKHQVMDKTKVPRLAFAIRLHDTFRPSEDIKDLLLQWLQDMPNIAEQVKIEAGFDAFSTLLIVSLPIAFCAYLSRDPAIISLGPITSGNRVSSNTSSLVVNQPSEFLPGVVPTPIHMVDIQAHPPVSLGSSEMLRVVSNTARSESGKDKAPEIFVEDIVPDDSLSRDLRRLASQSNTQEIVPQFEDLAMTPAPDTQPMRSKYATVSVLLLCWEADSYNDSTQPSQISKMKLRLEEVFTRLYGFQVEQWSIPELNSHNKLTRIISAMPNLGGHLNILYYVGHSESTPGGVTWRSYAHRHRNSESTVQWSILQDTFKNAHSDTLLLLDCFAEPPAPSIKYFGVTELIAADWKKKQEDNRPLFMFTDALIKGLTVFGNNDFVFTVKALASYIYAEMEHVCKSTATLDQFRLTYSGRTSVKLCSIKGPVAREIPLILAGTPAFSTAYPMTYYPTTDCPTTDYPTGDDQALAITSTSGTTDNSSDNSSQMRKNKRKGHRAGKNAKQAGGST